MLRGTRVGQAYVAVSADGSGINKDIVDAVDEAGPDVERAGEDHGERYGNRFSDGFLSRMKGKFADRLSTALHGDDVGGRAGDDAGDSFVDRMSDKVRDMGGRIGAELSDRLASNPEQVRRGIDRAFDDDMIDRVGDRVGARLAQSVSESFSREGDKIGAAFEKMLDDAVSGNGRKGGSSGGKKRGVGDIIGSIFGAGSRNNFLNAFGSSIGGITTLITKATTGAAGLFSTFKTGFDSATEGASFFSKVFAGFGGAGGKIGASFASLAASGPIAVAAIAAVVLALTVMVSVASALLGVVAALAATIASALVGALAVGAGAFSAIAVAAGLATLAFTSMTNAQKAALTSAFRPLKAEATGLGQIMLTQMVPAFERWSRNLQVALGLAKPLAEVMGGALARAGTIFTESLSGPGIQRFITALSVTLPGIITNLSRAFGQFLNGVGSVFAAIMPFVLRFSEYLSRVATDFARWANSSRGQDAITDFVTRALASLKSLWNFIKAVGGLIAAVFFSKSGQNAGNNIFDSMARALRKFTDYISKEDRLQHWFDEATRFAKATGKAIKTIGKVIEDLNDSKVIDVIFGLASAAESAYNWFDKLPGSIKLLLNPLSLLFVPVNALIDKFKTLTGLMNAANSWQPSPGSLTGSDALQSLLLPPMTTHPGFIGPIGPDTPATGGSSTNLDDLIASGMDALNNTYESAGGYMPDPTKGSKGPKFTNFEGGPLTEWQNTYLALAASIIKQGPLLADEIRAAARTASEAIRTALADSAKMFSELITGFGKSFDSAIDDAVKSTDITAIAASFAGLFDQISEATSAAITTTSADAQTVIDNAYDAANSLIASAQAARTSAAQALASATNQADADKALEALKRADKDLAIAKAKARQLIDEAQRTADTMVTNAAAAQARIDSAKSILAGQAVVTPENVYNLVKGLNVENATLSDYAEARRLVADQLAAATQKLSDALSLRDNYRSAVADSIRTFGSLMTAQAKTLNGVAQALTSVDITDNLQDRLTKIKHFQETLRQLLAAGLSDSAYKQLVDAGVEQGGAYADAILSGGQGSISEVNNLTDQIDSVANTLGDAAANQLYQAGVDAAQGLVDGLLSLSEQLDSAATQLGTAIANAIKKELGIASPSRVLMSLMDNVGDGAVIGLDNQSGKVSAAAGRLSSLVAVSPEVAAYASRRGDSPTTSGSGESGVSGNNNDPRFRDLIVHTPTEDPEAVAREVLNEVTGRLP